MTKTNEEQNEEEEEEGEKRWMRVRNHLNFIADKTKTDENENLINFVVNG